MAVEIKVPALGESVTEATVGRWFKHPGEAIALDEPVVELETDKVTVEVPAPAAGILASVAVAEGGTVAVGAVLGSIGEARAGSAAPQKVEKVPAPAPSEAAAKAAASGPAPAPHPQASAAPPSPAARKLMEERGLTAADVPGSGRHGEIL